MIDHEFEDSARNRGLLIDIQHARLDLGQVQQAVDQLQQPPAADIDIFDIFLLFGWQFLCLHEEQVGKADNRIQGRAQLMAGVGQELVFCLAGMAQLVIHQFQFDFMTAQQTVGAVEFAGAHGHTIFQFGIGLLQTLELLRVGQGHGATGRQHSHCRFIAAGKWPPPFLVRQIQRPDHLAGKLDRNAKECGHVWMTFREADGFQMAGDIFYAHHLTLVPQEPEQTQPLGRMNFEFLQLGTVHPQGNELLLAILQVGQHGITRIRLLDRLLLQVAHQFVEHVCETAQFVGAIQRHAVGVVSLQFDLFRPGLQQADGPDHFTVQQPHQ